MEKTKDLQGPPHRELHCVYDHWNTYAQLLIGEIVSHIEQQPQQETTANE